jgi:preprotein translocase subunit SecA
VPIENKRVTSAIANAQGQVESQNFESRKNVLKYDDVMDRQRKVIYGERREVLEGADIEDQVRSFIDDVVTGMVTSATEGLVVEWDLEQLWTDLGQLWPISVDRESYVADVGGEEGIDRDELIKTLQADAQAAYDTREAEVGEEVMRELERRVLLSVLDRKWREHLYEMDYLREGIYLRAYSQRDPLVEYQREGFDMFAAMMDGIKEEAVGFLFNLEVTVGDEDDEEEAEDEVLEPMRQPIPSAAPQPAAPAPAPVPASPLVRAKGLEPAKQPQKLSYSAPTEQGEVEVKGSTVTNADDPFAKVGRNAQCPCGSGKKYKMCHGRAGGPTGLTARPAG